MTTKFADPELPIMSIEDFMAWFKMAYDDPHRVMTVELTIDAKLIAPLDAAYRLAASRCRRTV